MANRFLSNIRINDAYILPASDGTSGQVISTDGAGNLSFIDAGSSGVPIIYKDDFSGDGTTVVFELANAVDNIGQTQLYIDGVYQEKETYSVSSTTLTFSTAPPSGTSIEVISFNGINFQGNFIVDTLKFTGGTGDQGLLSWNTEDETLDLVVSPNVTYQIGQELGHTVRNLSGGTLNNGAVVRVTGASGNKITVDLADNTAELGSSETFAVVTETISNNSTGKVTTEGLVRGLNTSAFAEGVAIWLGANGAFTDTKPLTPNHLVHIGWVVRSHATEGAILVKVSNGWEMEELHDVLITSVTDKDMLVWNNTQGYWENSKTLGDITTGNITTDGTVDGVDISAFKDAYDVHDHTESDITDFGNYLTNVTHDTVNTKLVVTKRDGTTQDLNLAQYIDDTNLARLTSGSLDAATGIATFTRDDATTFTVDFSALFDDTDTDTNDFLTGASFNTADGVLTLNVSNQTDVTVDLDGRYLESFTETDTLATVTARGSSTTAGITVNGTITLPQNPVGTTYGNGVSTVPSYMIQQGAGDNDGIRLYAEAGVTNDVRFIFEVVDDIETGDTWVFRNKKTYTDYLANEVVKISGAGDITASGTLSASGYNNSNWDTAYGWGNHADAGYLTSFDITTQTDSKYLRSDVSDTMSGNLTINSTGTANAATLKINNSSSEAFNHSIEVFTANLATGESNVVVVGKQGNTKNSGYLGYYWEADGSNNNYVSLGHWGADHLFRVYGDQILSTVTTRTNVDMRAPIFYDYNDTSYYLDPNSSSRIYGLELPNSHRLDKIKLYSGGSEWIGTSSGQLEIGGGSISFNGANNSGATTLKNGGNTWMNTSRQIFSPLYFDDDDTSYYVNPSAYTNLYDGNLELRKSYGIDLRSLDANTFYPIAIGVPASGIWLEVQVNLNTGTTPWSTHSSGFTLNVMWRTNGSGWGTTDIRRQVFQYHERFTNQTICGGIGQLYQSSREYIYLRGGGYYNLYSSRPISYDIVTTATTYANQNIAPRTDPANNVWESFAGSYYDYSDYLYTIALYDRNNTVYYLDPHSTSTLESLNMTGKIDVGTFSQSQTNSGEAWIGRAADRAQGTLTVQLGTGTSRKFEVVDYAWTTVEFEVNDSGDAFAANSFKAPLFYNHSDTSYYLDLNGYSRVNTLGAINPDDAQGISFRATQEVISGEGWCTAHYAYNNNDGFLFVNRDASSNPHPVFHIGGYNNAGYTGYGAQDSIITLTRSDGTKSTGSAYAGKGLSNSSYYTNIIKTTSGTVFRDAQGAHSFTGSITASGDIIAFSDESVKENVETIPNALEITNKLRGVTYNRTDLEDKSEKIGFIAQEVQKILPQVVKEQEDGMLGVSYGNITALLIEAVKELSNKVEELENKLNGTN